MGWKKKDNSYEYKNTQHLLGMNMSDMVAHGEIVSNLCYEVAKEMGMPEDFCEDMITAGFFHDIGKTVLGDGDLNEDEILVVEEMNSVRLHPQKGYDILKRHNYPESICRYVLCHHENMDGSGYPMNLDGSKIPLGACIIRVCDVFCALVQDRPYRQAFTKEQAIATMIEEVEKYNIEVFLAFQRVVHRTSDGSVQMPEISDKVRGAWSEL